MQRRIIRRPRVRRVVRRIPISLKPGQSITITRAKRGR